MLSLVVQLFIRSGFLSSSFRLRAGDTLAVLEFRFKVA